MDVGGVMETGGSGGWGVLEGCWEQAWRVDPTYED